MAIDCHGGESHRSKQCPSLRQQVIVIKKLLAQNCAQHQRRPAQCCPISSKRSPYSEKGCDATGVAMESYYLSVEGSEEWTPFTANEKCIQVKQCAAC